MYEFTVAYTEDIVRRSVRAVYGHALRRQLDWKLGAVFLLMIACLALSHYYGAPSWLDGAIASLLGLLVAFSVILYRTQLRRALDRLQRMKQPTGHFRVTEETLTVSSDLGSSTVPWVTFVGMSEHADFWVLNTSAGTGLTLPTRDISIAALNFIRRKINTSATEI